MMYQSLSPELPENWEILKIKDVSFNLQNGFSSSKKKDNGIHQLKPENIIKEGKISLNNVIKVQPPSKKEKYLLKKGDILFNNTNSPEIIGKTAIYSEEHDNYVYNNHITRIRVDKSKIDPEWLVYVLNWKLNTQYFQHIAGQTALARININDFKNIQIPVPPLEEQYKILNILSKVDNALIKAIELLKKTEELKKDLIGYLLYKGINNSQFKDSKIGEIPDSWDLRDLGEITIINRESRNPRQEPDNEFLYIDIKSVENGTGKIKDVNLINGESAPSRAQRVVHENDIIMSLVRPHLKAFAIIPKEYDNQICSTGFAVLTCKNEIMPQYLLYALYTEYSVEQYTNMIMGSQYPALNLSQVSKIIIPVPEIQEQQKIVEILSKVDNKLKCDTKRKTKLEKLKKGLMNELIMGKKRVKLN